MAPFYSHYVPYMPERLYPEVKVGFQGDFHNGDENNNGSSTTRIQIPSGVQLIPSRLPTGELALLVPQSAGISANFPFFPPAPEPTSRIGSSSAFTAVNRSHSPLLSPSTSTSSFGEESHNSEYPQSQSPNQSRHRFKIPEQSPSASTKSFSSSSSPETQKPHISSSSDRKSPLPATYAEPKSTLDIDTSASRNIDGTAQDNATTGVIGGQASVPNLRQPLSVITDKAYNRTSMLPKREGLKRHHSDGLLVISDKRPRYNEPSSSTINTSVNGTITMRNRDEHASSVEDLSGNKNLPYGRNPNGDFVQLSAADAGSSQANGDMWRPW